MKIRVWGIALLFSVISVSTKAQVDKQVEVTKRYIPQIEPTQKLMLQPDMSDTVRLRPEIDYTITPRSVKTTLTPRLYEPAKATFWEFNRPERLYIKAGIGAPISSLVDVYVSNSNPNTNYFIGYLNHEGEYAKIKNDYNERVSTTNSQNRVGGVAGVYIGDKILEGKFAYDFDTWSRYATQNPIIAHPTYQTISLSGSYGDQFVDYKRWNYLFDVDASYFANGDGDNSSMLGANLKFGGKFKGGKLISNVGYDYIGSNYKYQNNSLLLSSIYSFTRGGFDVDLGVTYIYDYISSEITPSKNNYVFPQLKVKYSSRRGIQPYVEIGGDIQRNNYAALTQINPYVAEGDYTYRNSVEYSLKVGASGVSGRRRFRYDIFMNCASITDALYWRLIEEEYDADKLDNYYTVESAALQAISINAHCDYRPLSNLSLKFGATLTDWKESSEIDLASGRANAEMYAGVEHTFKALRYGVSANFESKRYTTFTTETDAELADGSTIKIRPTTDVETPAAVNLKAFVEMTLKNRMVLFVEGNNLANANLYEWMGYREYGVGAMIGIKMQF